MVCVNSNLDSLFFRHGLCAAASEKVLICDMFVTIVSHQTFFDEFAEADGSDEQIRKCNIKTASCNEIFHTLGRPSNRINAC